MKRTVFVSGATQSHHTVFVAPTSPMLSASGSTVPRVAPSVVPYAVPASPLMFVRCEMSSFSGRRGPCATCNSAIIWFPPPRLKNFTNPRRRSAFGFAAVAVTVTVQSPTPEEGVTLSQPLAPGFTSVYQDSVVVSSAVALDPLSGSR